MRNRKKMELRAAGVRFPNSFDSNESGVHPRYTGEKATQTDIMLSKMATPNKTSTPRTPRLQRRRSLSVGSPPISKSAKDLCSPIRSPSKDKVDGTTPAGKKNLMKYSKTLIEVCQEFDRQHQQAKKEHLENKIYKRYHLCPKLNVESSDTTIKDVTDYSCTSTCACNLNNEQSTGEMATSGEDSRYDSNHTQQSGFLHLSSDSDDDESAKTVNGGEKKLAAEAGISTDGGKFPNDLQPEYFTQIRSQPEPNVPMSINNVQPPTSQIPEESQPNVSKSVPGTCEASQTPSQSDLQDSAEYRLYRHIRDVNASRAELDVTLLPRGACLVYSPKSKSLSVETSGDGEEALRADQDPKNEPPSKAAKTGMDPADFYSSK